MRGPAPKPVELKVIEGNPGKRQLPRSPKYAPLTEHPPDWLSTEARAEWRRLMREFDRVALAKRPDRASMIALCSWWDIYVRASKDITASGLTLVETHTIRGKSQTRTYPNPNIKTARDAMSQLLPLWQRFGMTPADRARLDMPEVPIEKDPFLELLT